MKKQSAARKTPAAKSPDRPARKRVGNVRGLILGLLESGPRSSAALVAEGGFSPAAVFLNIRALKQEGLVAATRQGREVLFSLTGAAPQPAAAAPVKPAKKAPIRAVPIRPAATKAVVLAYVPSELHAALNGLTRQLAPVEALADKLRVLDTLGRTLPAPIAAVLGSIAEDLQRIAASDAPIPF